jgi:cation:H+ antiporter
MFLDWVQLLCGGVVLYFGAEWLVKGAAGLALALGLRPLIVGLTVVAYGTSAPELTVGVASAIDGKGAIALGNAIGSNIANLGLILGMTTLISPPRVDAGLIRREIPFLVGTALLVPVLLLDGVINRFEGAVMVAASFGYTLWMVRRTPELPERPGEQERYAAEAAKEMAADAEGAGAPRGDSKPRLAGITVVGLVLLIGGGKLFVDGASGVAIAFGMSERLVGLTIVAVGTSLPELAASLVAALRGHGAIAVGNVIGSNIFNVLLILGSASAVRPLPGSISAMRLDLGFLVGLTLLAAIMLRTERVLRRSEGVALLLAYVGFLLALIISSR